MNILMVLNNPFTDDPRVYNEAISLLNAGNKVTVLAWDKYGKQIDKEKKDGIHIIRSNNSKFMDFLPYDIFRLHYWWRTGYRDAVKLFQNNYYDVIHCHDFASLPIGVKLKKKFGIKLIYDAHEIWGYMVKKDLPNIWANYYIKLEKRIIKNCDEIIIAEDKYADYFKSITDTRLTAILNCKKIFLSEYEKSKNMVPTFIYIGTLTPPRFIEELIEVVKEIDNVKCIIGGIGKKKYVEIIENKAKRAKNVEFIGKVPFKEVIPLTLESDVVVCMINPSNYNNKIATANKQFEAMVCGRPIICTNGTRSGEITEEELCGLVVEFSKNNLRKAIVQLRDSPDLCIKLGKNALNAAIKKYNWANQKNKLLEIYKNL